MIHHGDCRKILPSLEQVDAVVTDPPYGLDFMGKGWDHGVPGVEFWEQILSAMKPGAHLLAFGGTRTHHRLMVAIEDSGFEIRDCLMWVYGTGFPKSLDVGKAIDKAAGAERKIVGSKLGQPGYSLKPNDTQDHNRTAYSDFQDAEKECAITAPATDEARQWDGWGTALKPAWEPIILARRPLEGTVSKNVVRHGTGGLNIDECRVGVDKDDDIHAKNPHTTGGFGHAGASIYGDSTGAPPYDPKQGRWPANLIHDGSEEVTGILGPAARFFYCAKANKKERGKGNDHPTVKPLALMRYLCRLVTPPGGTVLDPFMGSGSTLLAARAEGFQSIGIEIEKHSCEIARGRLA